MPHRFRLMIHRKLDVEDIISILTFCPDPTPVGFYDGLRYGQSQAVAAVHGSCLIRPVEPLEYIFQILSGDCLAWA